MSIALQDFAPKRKVLNEVMIFNPHYAPGPQLGHWATTWGKGKGRKGTKRDEKGRKGTKREEKGRKGGNKSREQKGKEEGGCKGWSFGIDFLDAVVFCNRLQRKSMEQWEQ